LSVCGLFAACGEERFGGGTAHSQAPAVQAGKGELASEQDQIAEPTKKAKEPKDYPPGDDGDIARCLAKLGDHPFGKDPEYRKIAASVQILGSGDAVVDRAKTAEPELVLITAAIAVLGKASYQLLNPNGWYCMKVDVNVMADTTVRLACGAHLADSKVNVGVLSDAEPIAKVDVNVMSSVKVAHVGSCED
jgi:hypothetical protein